jgi:TetR/AcrR family transcriptional regulator, transcriptional repressor for nem operon
MRYEKGHKDETRKQIVKAASRRFRRDGIEAVGVAALMADAGLTHGGFYSHFASKEALVRAANADALARGRAALAQAAARDGAEGIIRAYMRPSHRDRPEHGCAFAALTSEIARHPGPTRAALTQEFEAHVALIAGCLPRGDRQTAIAILSVMMGAIQFARAAPDRALSDAILDSGTQAALILAQTMSLVATC